MAVWNECLGDCFRRATRFPDFEATPAVGRELANDLAFVGSCIDAQHARLSPALSTLTEVVR